MTERPLAQQRGQLPLAVNLRDDATLDNFLARPGLEPLVAAVGQLAQGGGEPFTYLYGPPGAGKSHLLQAACQSPGVAAQYLPLAGLGDYAPDEVLQGLDGMQLVCLDDLQAVAHREDWALALFNFYNTLQGGDCRLLLAAREAPRTLALPLEDLRSRLSSAVVYRMDEAGDEEKAGILAFRARRRGMALPAGVAAYIVSRAPRALHDLLLLLDDLDRESLVSKRSLSIPFVRETLGW